VSGIPAGHRTALLGLDAARGEIGDHRVDVPAVEAAQRFDQLDRQGDRIVVAVLIRQLPPENPSIRKLPSTSRSGSSSDIRPT
jgi:hypothetical protein